MLQYISQGSLTEGKGSVQLTSLSAAFVNENFIYSFTKQATLMRKSTIQSPPLRLVLPVSPLGHRHTSNHLDEYQ